MDTTPKIHDDIERFLQDLADQDRATSTIESYGRDLRLFARWFEQSNGRPFVAQALTAIDVRQYRQYLKEPHGDPKHRSAPATINRALAALRAFAAWAVHVGELSVDPLERVRGVKEQEHGARWLEKDEQGRLEREVQLAVNAARTEAARQQALRDRAIVMLLLNTGLRVAELCALELDDVEISERKGAVVVRDGKGGKRRMVPLNGEARHALRAWRDVRPASDLPAYFLGKRGEALRPSGVQRLLSEYGRRAGIAAMTPHVARHTFAKRLIDSGESLDRVATLLGHDSLDTTRIYTKPSKRDLERAVGRIGEE